MVGNGALADEEETAAPEKRAAIVRLMEVTKAAEIGTQMGHLFAQQITQMSGAETDEAVARCREITSTVIGEALPGLFDEVIPIYEKHFTHEEILAITAFHESPIGKKSIEVMPQLMAESMQVAQRWTMEMMPRLQEKVLAQLREEGLIAPEEAAESTEG